MRNGFIRLWNRLREAFRASRRRELYMNKLDYYRAKRGDL